MADKAIRLGSVIACISLFIALISPVPLLAQPCDPPVATAVSVQGTVEVQKAGGSGWQPAGLNDTFCPGDTIRTGANSRAALALASEAVMRLDADSTFTLQEFKEKRSSVVDMFKGAAHFFSRQPKSLEVRTPYTIAGVRGTEFFIQVDDTQTFLSIFEGNVLAANEAGELNLTSGQSAVAEKDKAPVLRVVARPRDAVQWALYYPPVIYDAPANLIDQSPESITDPKLLTQQAALFLNVGRVEQASKNLDRALAINPNDGDALALQSIISIVQNDNDKALELAQKATDTDPNSATALISLSYAQQARFDLESARAALMQATKVAPNNALAWARLSEIEASFGRLGKSLDAAKKAESLAPDLSLTQAVLGFANLTQVRIDDAKAAFEKAIALDQASPMARLGLGLAKIRAGDLKGGGHEIETAASLDPNNSLVRSYLGKTFYEQKRIGLDEKEFDIAKELDPNDPTPHFYSAIAKQTTNRPVEALQDMEKAIELNDNRAVYRSKLLLDSDLAARSSSLARIYNNLGFQQRGLVEGWNSVNTDPSNFSAHRFLSDTYSALPRHEVARVSELLQSQLLQPTNITPLQPALAESNLFLISSQGPSAGGFNTFNPMFNRNQGTLTLNGLVGDNTTWAAEGIASGVYNRFSLSAGYSHFETDGWRVNAGQDDDIANIFAQYEFNYKTSIQAEYRRRTKTNGDLELRFLEDDFRPNLEENEETSNVRLGIKHAFSPSSILLGNFAYQDSDLKQGDQPAPFLSFDRDLPQTALSGELQYLHRSHYFDVVSGIGYFDIDAEDFFTVNISTGLPPPFPATITQEDTFDRGVEHTNLYLYSYIKPLDNLTFTLGASGDFFKSDNTDTPDENQFNPKVGISWNPIPSTTVRAAAFRTLKRTLVTDQTLEPTQVAGFNQFFDDANAVDAWRYGAAIDQKIFKNLYGGVEYSQRDLEVPYNPAPEQIEVANWDEKLFRGYLYWAPHRMLAFTADYYWEQFDRDEELAAGARTVKTSTLPLGINFYHPDGLSATVKGSYISQRGSFERANQIGVFEDGKDNFWLFDAAVSYVFPKRFGFLTVGMKNIFDEEFNYFDTDPKNPRIQPGRYFFGKITLALP